MNRKSKIVLVSMLMCLLLAGVPVGACCSPLLSGYGGPGAGEQAIIGSTLSGGSSGGGSGSSSGSLGSGSASQSGAGASTRSGTGSTVTRGAHAAGSTGGSSGSPGHAGGAPHVTGPVSSQATGTEAKQTDAFVYPNSLRAAPSSSPALGISGGDLLVLLAVLATLALVGTVTLRLSRLQR